MGPGKKITASFPFAGDQFGISVAISGDTVVVGANGDDDAGSSSGSAYIFSRNKGGADQWGQVKKLWSSDANAYNSFGYSVAISGDTVVVGARLNDDAGTSSGSAYIFSRNKDGSDQWGQVKKLTASDADEGDKFGGSVAMSGDTVVVGAYGNDDGGSASGSAYIFSRNKDGSDQWGQVKTAGVAGGNRRAKRPWPTAAFSTFHDPFFSKQQRAGDDTGLAILVHIIFF